MKIMFKATDPHGDSASDTLRVVIMPTEENAVWGAPGSNPDPSPTGQYNVIDLHVDNDLKNKTFKPFNLWSDSPPATNMTAANATITLVTLPRGSLEMSHGTIIASAPYELMENETVNFFPKAEESGLPYTHIFAKVMEGETVIDYIQFRLFVPGNKDTILPFFINYKIFEDVEGSINLEKSIEDPFSSVHSCQLLSLPQGGTTFEKDKFNLRVRRITEESIPTTLSVCSMGFYPSPNVFGDNYTTFDWAMEPADIPELFMTSNISIIPTPDEPWAEPMTLDEDQGYEGLIALDVGDVDGDNFTIVITDLPVSVSLTPAFANGTLAGPPVLVGNIPYEVIDGGDPGVFLVQFENRVAQPLGVMFYHARDWTGLESPIVTVTFNSKTIITPPWTKSSTIYIEEDERIQFRLSAGDDDGHLQSLTLESLPEGTLAESSDGTFIVVTTAPHHIRQPNVRLFQYTPPSNAFGSPLTTFSFHVIDADNMTSSSSVVTFNVESLNDLPYAEDASISTREDTPINVTLLGFDYDTEDSVILEIVKFPRNGQLYSLNPLEREDSTLLVDQFVENGTVVWYVPGRDLNSPTDDIKTNVFDEFFYVARETPTSKSLSAAQVTITFVEPVNDLPRTYDSEWIVDEDSVSSLALYMSDPDSMNLTVFVVVLPLAGALIYDNGTSLSNCPCEIPLINGEYTVRYQAPHDAEGFDFANFTYEAKDGEGSSISLIIISISAVNDVPVAHDSSVTIEEDTTEIITLNSTDIDSENLSILITKLPKKGQLFEVYNYTFDSIPFYN